MRFLGAVVLWKKSLSEQIEPADSSPERRRNFTQELSQCEMAQV
jgi:hypothetical protein